MQRNVKHVCCRNQAKLVYQRINSARVIGFGFLPPYNSVRSMLYMLICYFFLEPIRRGFCTRFWCMMYRERPLSSLQVSKETLLKLSSTFFPAFFLLCKPVRKVAEMISFFFLQNHSSQIQFILSNNANHCAVYSAENHRKLNNHSVFPWKNLE